MKVLALEISRRVMREFPTGQEDPLRSLILKTAILLLSSVVSQTSAFSLKHEALVGPNKNSQSETAEAIAAVTGISPPLVDKAISFFDSTHNVLNGWKGLPNPEQFKPFQPFHPLQPIQHFGGPPAPKPPPIPYDEKDQGIYIPKPPEIPEPIQITINEAPVHHPEDSLVEPKPPEELEAPLEVIEPLVIDPHEPEDPENFLDSDEYPSQGHVESMTFLLPVMVNWSPSSNMYPTNGQSQYVSLSVTGNVPEFSTSNNVNLQVISTDGNKDSSKHIIGFSKPSSEKKS